MTLSPHIPRRTVAAVVFWDFDGTVYRAPAGCRRYGEEIASSLAPENRSEYLARLDQYLSGQGGSDAPDGWEAAVELAAEYPLARSDGPVEASADARQGVVARGGPGWYEEFRRSREYLENGDCPLQIPAGFPEAVSRMRPVSRHVLLSNTPSFGVFGLLHRLNLAECFDEVVCEAAKPAMLAARLSAAASAYDLPTKAVLSVGDHFGNDIAPALGAGAAGAYVNSYGVGPRGKASLEAPTLEELLPRIERWLAGTVPAIAETGAGRCSELGQATGAREVPPGEPFKKKGT